MKADVIRKPDNTKCSNCGAKVKSGMSKCPKCNNPIIPVKY